MLHNTCKEEVEASINLHCAQEGICYSDENSAYGPVGTPTRAHKTVCHSAHEWARDEDGDGINEVHTNTIEGLWTQVRNFLRCFKGVSKHYLHLYVAMFEWMHNLKRITVRFIQALVFSPTGT